MVIFIIDLYVSTHSAAPNVLRCTSFIRALIKDKEWSRAKILHALCCKHTTAWFSEQYKLRISERLEQDPSVGEIILPTAWSVCEALSTSWKHSYETLKLWTSAVRFSPAASPFSRRVLQWGQNYYLFIVNNFKVMKC